MGFVDYMDMAGRKKSVAAMIINPDIETTFHADGSITFTNTKDGKTTRWVKHDNGGVVAELEATTPPSITSSSTTPQLEDLDTEPTETQPNTRESIPRGKAGGLCINAKCQRMAAIHKGKAYLGGRCYGCSYIREKENTKNNKCEHMEDGNVCGSRCMNRKKYCHRHWPLHRKPRKPKAPSDAT